MAKPGIPIALPYGYATRPYQSAFWEAMLKKKRAVLVWHRRAGKEKTCWNYMIQQAVKRKGIYYYIFPDSKMARRIIWDGIDKQGFKTLDHIPQELVKHVNNTEMKVYLHSGSLIMVLGSRDVDSLRGPNPIGCVFSEYAEQSPQAWSTISPILRENGGWAVFNFTPKGQNHAKELYDMAYSNPEWFAQKLTVEDTGAVPLEEIEKERQEGIMSEDMIQQEYYVSFTLGIEGSYYAKYMRSARDSGRVGNVPHDTQASVHTAWDIGFGDSTAIVFYQLCGQEVHVIDYYEAHGEGLEHYVRVLREKPYVYGQHFGPHDIQSHAFSTGLSTLEVAAGLGFRFQKLPTLRISFDQGIEAVRGLFPQVWIDEKKCKQLIKCLENYRKKYDANYRVYGSTPVHDCWSHGADAFRYMCIAIRRLGERGSDEMNDSKAQRLYEQHNPRFE